MIFSVLMLFVGAHAQNANRSGAVIELGGGYNMSVDEINKDSRNFVSYFMDSPTYYYEPGWHNKEGQGVYLSLDAGYQWATSTHFSIKAMATVGVPINYSNYTNFGLKCMLRYSSNDFGNGQSVYVEAGAGPKMWKNAGVYFLIAPEIGAGLNINSHLYLGLDFVYNIITDDGQDPEYQDWRNLSYGVPQLKIGYRF